MTTDPAPLAPRRRWLWVLLGLSVTLNLAFLGGFLYLRGKSDGLRSADQHRFAQTTQGLGLTPEEQQGLMRMRRQILENRRQDERDLRIAGEELGRELSKATPDRAAILRTQERIAALRGEQYRRSATLFVDYLLTVAPERRPAMIQFARQRIPTIAGGGPGGEPGQRGPGFGPGGRQP